MVRTTRTPIPAEQSLGRLSARPDRSGILLDFDGTLAPIVRRPEDARPVAGADQVLGGLVERFALVAVISGRPAREVRERLDVPGLRIEGLYGLEGRSGSASAPVSSEVVREVEAELAGIDGARLEDKGLSVAAHVRETADPDDATRRLRPLLEAIAGRHGMRVVDGKRVLELVPAGRPLKDAAVHRLLEGASLDAALYAGDDTADLDAFAALEDEVGVCVRVAVRGPETPDALAAAAEIVVEGPAELLHLLREL